MISPTHMDKALQKKKPDDVLLRKFRDLVLHGLTVISYYMDADYETKMHTLRVGMCKMLGDSGTESNVNSRGDVFLLACVLSSHYQGHFDYEMNYSLCAYVCILLLGFEKLKALKSPDMKRYSSNVDELIREYYESLKGNTFLMAFLSGYDATDPEKAFKTVFNAFHALLGSSSPSSDSLVDSGPSEMDIEVPVGSQMGLHSVRQVNANTMHGPIKNSVVRPSHAPMSGVVRHF